MKYIGDEWVPRPLRDALIDSPNKYKEDLNEFLSSSKKHEIQVSVTSLPKSPRELILIRRHYGDIIRRPTENWHTLQGSIFHLIMEKYAPSHWEKEVRNGIIVKTRDTRVLFHGQFDAFDTHDGILYDWKYTSAYSMMFPQDNYDFQLNAGKRLLEIKGRKVNKLVNIYGFKHLDPRYLDNPRYPKEFIMAREVPIWDGSKVRDYYMTRIRNLVDAWELPDAELPLCTDEERWVRGTMYKVYKRTKPKSKKDMSLTDWGKNAIFSSESEQEAKQWMEQNPQQEEMKLEEKKGEPGRCKFCDAAPFCNQRQRELRDSFK